MAATLLTVGANAASLTSVACAPRCGHPSHRPPNLAVYGLMKSELVRMRKEAFILSVVVVFKYLAEGTEANYEESVKIAGLRTEIKTRDSLRTKE